MVTGFGNCASPVPEARPGDAWVSTTQARGRRGAMADHSLKGKVLVVGAGAKNLGGLISRTFGAEGALVTVHYNSDSTKAAADETVKAVNKGGGDAFGVQGDLTKVSEVRRLFDEAVKRYGRVDIAVNTVGKVLKKPFVETNEEEYDSMFDINAKAAYFFIQEAGKRMNDGGKIITILTSLLAAFTGLYSTYAGSKAPVEHFTRAAAKEFGPRGISVNNVAAGCRGPPAGFSGGWCHELHHSRHRCRHRHREPDRPRTSRSADRPSNLNETSMVVAPAGFEPASRS